MLTALRALGCPGSFCCIQNLPCPFNQLFSVKSSLRGINRYLEEAIGANAKAFDCLGDLSNLFRQLSETTLHDVSWRQIRSYMISDSLEVIPDVVAPVVEGLGLGPDGVAAGGPGGVNACALRIGGYLRGIPLCAHSLVHIPGVGTGRIERVEIPALGGPFEAHAPHRVGAAEESSLVLVADPGKQDPLQLEAAADGVRLLLRWLPYLLYHFRNKLFD